MMRKLLIVATAAGLACTAVSAQQQDFSQVQIKSEKLADNLYMLVGAGGNIGLLVGPDGAVVVDDQFAPLAPKVQAAIASITDKPVRFILNTHFHFDHTGGNEAFGKAGGVIIAHDNTRKRLSGRQSIPALGLESPPVPEQGLPVVTFAQSMSLHLNGEDVEATHLPNAHTDSDVALFFRKANVVHVGDVFAGPFYPFVDSDNGGSLDGIVAAAETLLKMTRPDTRFLRGHAPVASRADLQEYRDMLVTVRQRISDAIKAGKTQEQVVAAQVTREFDAKFGGGSIKPDVFVRRAYVDLRRRGRKT